MNRGFGSTAIALAACVALAGCAAERVSGLKRSSPEAAPQRSATAAAATVPPACRFSIKAIDDRREHASLGSLGRTPVDEQEFLKWLGASIAEMPEYSPGPAPIAMSFEVVKTYIQGLSTLKSAHLVVRVKAVGEKIQPFEKVYRGVDNSINWANTESEIQVAFEMAAAHLKQQIASDLSGLCGRPPAPAPQPR